MASHVDEEELNDFLDKVNLVKSTINELSTNEPSAIAKADKVIKQLETEQKEKETATLSSTSPDASDASSPTEALQLYRLGDGWNSKDHVYYCTRCKIEILYDIYDLDQNDESMKQMIEQFNSQCNESNTSKSSENDRKIRCGACPKCGVSSKQVILSATERKEQLQERVDALKKEYTRRQERRQKWEKYDKMRKETENKLENREMRKKSHVTDYEEWNLWEPEIDMDDYTEDGFIPDIPEARAMAADMKKRAEKKRDQMKAATKEKEEGNAALKEGNYSAAIRHYSIGIDYCRDYKQLYTNRALAYMKTGQYNKCIEDCTTVVDMIKYIDEEESQSDVAFKAYLRRANGHKMLGNLEDALTDALVCKKLRPKKKEVLTFLDEVQVLLYSDRQRKKMQMSMSEKKEEMSDFDTLFDQIVAQLEFELSSNDTNDKSSNASSDSAEKKQDSMSPSSPKSLKQNRRTFDRILRQLMDLMSNSVTHCVRFADRNGIELISRCLQTSLQSLQKSLSNLSKNETTSNSSMSTTSTKSAASEAKRREAVATRVEVEMEMRTFCYLFNILNFSLENDVNLAFLRGRRTQEGYGRLVQTSAAATTASEAKDKVEEKEDAGAVTTTGAKVRNVARAMKLYKKERKQEKIKKRDETVVQMNGKQMKLIVGSLIFYVLKDLNKYNKELQRAAIKFVSRATEIDAITKWLCQIHAKVVVKCVAEVLAQGKKSEGGTLKRRRGMKLKSKANEAKSTAEDGFDLDALEFVFVTLLNFLNFEENELFLKELLQFNKPYIFVGLFNKLNEFGNFILQSQSVFERFKRNANATPVLKTDFEQKQHIISIVLNVLSKVFVNDKLVRAFVSDTLTNDRIKSLLKHLTRLTDVFAAFESVHLPTLLALQSENSVLPDALLEQHGITMNQMAKCLNVLLSLVHHSASHGLLLDAGVHTQLFDMIGIIYDANHRQTLGDKDSNKIRDTMENYDLLIDSIQDNLLGFFDKVSIYPEFDVMIESGDFLKHSVLAKGSDMMNGRKWRYSYLRSNKTMLFWNYILSTFEDRQKQQQQQTQQKKESKAANASEEKESEIMGKRVDNTRNKFYFEACGIRMFLRWLKRGLRGEDKSGSGKNNIYFAQIVETFIFEWFQVFCVYLKKIYAKQVTVVANITLVLKQFLIYIKNYKLYVKMSGTDLSEKVIENKSNELKQLVISNIVKLDGLNDIMDLFRNDDQTVRRNAVTLMAQLATFDDELKEKIRDIGAMTAMYQLQREVVTQSSN